jgi:predicted dehydrogenase
MPDRIKIAVVGLNFGMHVVGQITEGEGRDYMELVGLCDLDTTLLAEQSSKLGVKAYASLDDVIADPRIEAVGLFTRPAGRAELIRKVVRAGKHVFTTKPFELDAVAALGALREARDLGKIVAMNSPSPVLPPDLSQVADWRGRFDLGAPVGARFEVLASYNEQPDGKWYDDPALCPVAPVFRIGIYLINDAVRIFGEADEVCVLSSRLRTGRPTSDNAQLGVRFRSGAIANIFATFCVDDGDNHRNQMTLNFERGTIYRNCGPIQSAYKDNGTEMWLVRRGGEGREVTEHTVIPNYHPQFAYQWKEFHQLVRGEELEVVSPETVAGAVRIIEAMVKAETGGGFAKVAPVTG